MKTYIMMLFVLFGMACNDGSKSNIESSLNLDGFEVEDYENGISNIIKYDENRIPIESGYLHNGVKNGVWVEHWAENGRFHILTTYVNGIKNGPYLEFTNRGQIEKKSNYANGKLDGQSGTYKFGRTEMLERYKDGLLDGDHKEYFKSGTSAGKLQKLVQYKEGKQHGKLMYYDEEGNIMMQYIYENGKKVSGGMTK